MSDDTPNKLAIRGTELELRQAGSGPTILFLHPHLGLWKAEPFLEELSRHFTLLAPSHPGFESSPVVEDFTTVDDLSYFYLDLLEQLDLRDVIVVGSSLGGWIALALAVKDSSRVRSLILLDPTGAHFGGPEQESVADIFSMGEEEFSTRGFAISANGRKDYAEMTDHDLLISARNREAAARYAWMPPLYDPKMTQRLHRIAVPTLILWGESDHFTDRDYAAALTAAIPGATLETIPGAGHFPHIEQPDETVSRIRAFAGL